MTLIDNVGSYGVSKYGCAVRFSHELIKEAELKRGLVKLHLMAIIDTLLAEDSIFDVGSRDLIFKIKAETRSPAEHEYENEPPYLSMSMEDREELWSTIQEDKWKIEYCRDVKDRRELWSTIKQDTYKYSYCHSVKDRKELWSTIQDDRLKF